MTPRVLAIVGPTGAGKTAVSVALADHLPIEVISIDSLQIFRHLDIGSAKPTAEQRKNLPHHMIDVRNPDENVTAAWYSGEARAAIDDVLARKKIPLLVGGAGFYFKAVAFPPLEEEKTDIPQPTLEEAKKLIEEKDPDFFRKIHPNDAYRIVRAGQLILQGHLPSRRWKETEDQAAVVDIHMICPDHERSVLHDRINQRVFDMVDQGLVEETQRVVDRFPASEAKLSKAIGYRESLLFLNAKVSKEDMIQGIQTASRQYAKRQLTWFRAQKNISWVPFAQVADHALALLRQDQPS